jgi:hypothetical protein
MSALILTLINPKLSFFASAELNILGIGILFAFFSLLATQLIEKYFLAPSTQEEI